MKKIFCGGMALVALFGVLAWVYSMKIIADSMGATQAVKSLMR